MRIRRQHGSSIGIMVIAVSLSLVSFALPDQAQADFRANPPDQCNRMLTADIVAIDMPLMWNRLGAQNINGMMYALRRDVINLKSKLPLTEGGDAVPGMVALRPDKRPRPLVLHMGKRDCLTITLQNLLTENANPFDPILSRSGIPFRIPDNDAVAERRIGLRFQGTELVKSIADDSSNVGKNVSSLVASGERKTFTIFAPHDGAFIGESMGATTGGEGQGGHTPSGLWAVLTVNSQNSSFYRSQLTREEMDLATVGFTADGHPIVDYEKRYPDTEPWRSEGKARKPVVNMIDGGNIVHSELNAIIAYGPSFTMAPAPDGPHAGELGHFPIATYPLESNQKRNPSVPNRLEPFREFTVAFHDEVATQNAFPLWFDDPVLGHTLHGVRDSFMINYGSGGIGSEIIASRLRVGPMHDCIGCAYEEFFLSFSTVGEVGQLVDIPANVGLENCKPDLNGCGATGPKANYALYPDDPSNVHHSYQGDSVAFRNLHAGGGEQHVFHLHNHQWLFNADDDNSNYLDAQGLGPGSGYAYWINFGGSGNRNKSAGDVIFHCHFYPHFAQGMWEMWRVHDTFEQGTQLQTTVLGGGAHASFVNDGIGLGKGLPADEARALPDGEIRAGVPIPALVPLPGKPMAPMPAGVTVVENPNQICVGKDYPFGLFPNEDCHSATDKVLRATGSLAKVDRVFKDGFLVNPGYPFWIAGIEHTVGQRPPTPPLDMMNSARAQRLTDIRVPDPNDPTKSIPHPLWQHEGFADPASIQGWDGGLPRFTLDGYSAGSEAVVAMTRLDFSKEILRAKPFFFPEEGTDLEQAAMWHHSKRCHDTFLPNGDPAPCVDENNQRQAQDKSLNTRKGFVTNGGLPIAGAPFYEPCMDDRGKTLSAGVTGKFFGANLTAMDDYLGMTVEGKSPFNATNPRVYKGANVQFDAVFNKLGYHFPQERILTLWQDVIPTINKQRPPEPLVIRLNTFDCTSYVHSNVVPKVYELDDYQVRTPTDVIGQHIHLPKWDLVSADGSANGWNYEDGTLSPEAVVEVIHAINEWQRPLAAGSRVTTYTDSVGQSSVSVQTSAGFVMSPKNYELHAQPHPYFGAKWLGARSTIQRWFADPVVNVQGVDRGLGIIFTHDHFGPSTHQQIGLYATVLIEPAGSKWVHNETGTQLYTRTGPEPSADGGPTSWQAAILTDSTNRIPGYTDNVFSEKVEPYREFYLEYSDFQHAYQPGVYIGAGPDGQRVGPAYEVTTEPISPGLYRNTAALVTGNPDSFRDAIQPSVRQQAPLVGGFPKDIWIFPAVCPGGVPRPCAEAISADDPGMNVVNYRNESLIARVFDPNRTDCPGGQPGCQAFGPQGDLAMAMVTNVTRAIPELNSQLGKAPAGYAGGGRSPFLPPINQLSALAGGDPFTPMMRTYDGDNIAVKVQAGGQEEEHTLLLHGLKWLQAGSGFGQAKSSGWRNAQPGGISEQFTFRMPIYSDYGQRGSQADYAYTTNNGFDGWASGVWGIIRSYSNGQNTLFKMPTNDVGKTAKFVNGRNFDRVCPKTLPDGMTATPQRDYDITAVLAEDVLDVPRDANGGSLVTIQDLFPGAHAGRAPASNGGTLVFNSRITEIPGAEAGEAAHRGPLHDPAGILYVKTSDLVADNDKPYPGEGDPRCWTAPTTGIKWKYTPWLPTCPVHLKPEVPVEPIVIRAAAGDCINVTLRNKTLEQAVTKSGNWPIYNDLGKPVFLDLGDKSKGLWADTNADGKGDKAVTRNEVAFDSMPDLAVPNPLPAMVRLNRDDPQGMTSVQSNLLTPSPFVGLHPALVEYDVTRSDGTEVGQNNGNRSQTAGPGEQVTYQWYAGHLSAKLSSTDAKSRNYELVATPIEFGGFNIMPADKIEQPQHGLVGAGVVYPQGATWTVDPGTNTSATVNESGTGGPWVFRDFSIIAQKGVAMFYADSFPVHNLEGAEGSFGVTEDSQDMGGMTINYGTEPLWFRFGVNPNGHGVLHDVAAGDAYSNSLVGGDPQTALFRAKPGQPFRMHVLMPAGAGRGSTFDLHGHVWQREPYVCPPTAKAQGVDTLPGRCDMGNGMAGAAGNGEVGSKRLAGLGHPGQWRYESPMGMAIGGIESWYPGEHWEVVLPSAGGGRKIPGDYLFRDHMGKGNASGLWGILRVE